MGENEIYWFHLITFCLVCQLQELGNYRHVFSFSFYVFHVEIKWRGKLLGGAKEKEGKEKLCSLQSNMGFWGAVFASETFFKNPLLISFETDCICLYNLWAFFIVLEII